MRTLRTHRVGKFTALSRLGDAWLRRENPVVATFAGAEWLDIRITAVNAVGPDCSLRSACDIVHETAAHVRAVLSGQVWADGWRHMGPGIATVQAGTRGQLGTLLPEVSGLIRAPMLGDRETPRLPGGELETAVAAAARARGATVAVALLARDGRPATSVNVAVADPVRDWSRRVELRLFRHGPHG